MNIYFQLRRARTPRRGATLIELLIVILVMLSVTAVTIPAIAPAMKNRRIREGARMVSVFINAARNRAMETGRPTGIWIERQSGIPEAAITLHFCEQPPAYCGDFDDSRVKIFIWPRPYRAQTYSHNTPYTPLPERVCHYLILQPWGTHAPDLDAWADAEPGKQYLVQEGDRIKINFQTHPFTLRRRFFSDLQGGRWAWYVGEGYNARINHNGGFVSPNQRDDDWNFIIRWYYGIPEIDGHWHPRFTGDGTEDFQNLYRGQSYRIIRRPQKLAAGAIQLPEGVIIDMNYSGSSGFRMTDPGVPFHPRRDPGDTSNSPYRGEAIFPTDQTPVIMLMSPNGEVSELYHWVWNGKAHNPDPANPVPAYEWKPEEPFGQIYFLIGQSKKVPAQVARTTAAQVQNNWTDMNNIWVTVNAQTGMVTTAELGDFVDLADTLSADPYNVHRTRDIAERVQPMGGR